MDYDYADVRKRVIAMATQAAKFEPKTEKEAGLLGSFVGALYALDRAAELGYEGDRLKNAAYMTNEFLEVARHLSGHGAMPRPWLAGFFVTDVVARLEALGTKMKNAHPNKRNYFWDSRALKVMQDGSNLEKKEPEVQVGGSDRWEADLRFATQAAEYVCRELPLLYDLLEQRRQVK